MERSLLDQPKMPSPVSPLASALVFEVPVGPLPE